MRPAVVALVSCDQGPLCAAGPTNPVGMGRASVSRFCLPHEAPPSMLVLLPGFVTGN